MWVSTVFGTHDAARSPIAPIERRPSSHQRQAPRAAVGETAASGALLARAPHAAATRSWDRARTRPRRSAASASASTAMFGDALLFRDVAGRTRCRCSSSRRIAYTDSRWCESTGTPIARVRGADLLRGDEPSPSVRVGGMRMSTIATSEARAEPHRAACSSAAPAARRAADHRRRRLPAAARRPLAAAASRRRRSPTPHGDLRARDRDPGCARSMLSRPSSAPIPVAEVDELVVERDRPAVDLPTSWRSASRSCVDAVIAADTAGALRLATSATRKYAAASTAAAEALVAAARSKVAIGADARSPAPSPRPPPRAKLGRRAPTPDRCRAELRRRSSPSAPRSSAAAPRRSRSAAPPGRPARAAAAARATAPPAALLRAGVVPGRARAAAARRRPPLTVRARGARSCSSCARNCASRLARASKAASRARRGPTSSSRSRGSSSSSRAVRHHRDGLARRA